MKFVFKKMFDIEKRCVQSAKKIICVSKATISDAREYYGDYDYVYVPNGINVEKYNVKAIKKEFGFSGPVVGFVGYLHKRKGVHELLEVFPQAKGVLEKMTPA